MKRILISAVCSMFFLFLLSGGGLEVLAQEDSAPKKKLSDESKKARQDSLRLLEEMREILEKYYYDPNYRGINLEERFKAAEERIKSLEYNWQMYRVLVQVLMDFDDSHTTFHLPPRTDYFDYGFSMQMFGNDCYVTNVKKDSDAEKQGLAVGDRILNIGKYVPTRQHLWKIIYVLYKLDPADTVDLKIEKPNGKTEAVTVKAKTMTQKERRAELKKKKSEEKFKPQKCQEINSEILACKFYTFSTERDTVDKMMKQARNYKKLILDLRGNSGGYVVIEEYLVGHFFDRDVKIADVTTRKKTETRIGKTRGDKVFNGDLTVLIDSRSASAAEMFARVMQLERRGKVIGDVSSGAVMTSFFHPMFSPASAFATIIITSVGMSVTVADVVMKDGKRLEKVGVIPDVAIVPSAEALSKKYDPVLAYAANSFGAELTPEKAGEFYFITQKEIDEDLDEDVEGN